MQYVRFSDFLNEGLFDRFSKDKKKRERFLIKEIDRLMKKNENLEKKIGELQIQYGRLIRRDHWMDENEKDDLKIKLQSYKKKSLDYQDKISEMYAELERMRDEDREEQRQRDEVEMKAKMIRIEKEQRRGTRFAREEEDLTPPIKKFKEFYDDTDEAQ